MSLGPIPLDGKNVLVLGPSPSLSGWALDDPGRVVLVAPAETAPPAGAAEVERRPRLSLLRPDPALKGLDCEDVVVFDTAQGLRTRDVVGAIRHGGRRFHLVDGPGSHYEVNARGALVLSAWRRLAARLAGTPLGPGLERALGTRLAPPWPEERATAACPGAVVEFARTQPTPAVPAQGPLRIAHYIGALGPGGAERQLMNQALASHGAGHAVRVLTAEPLDGDAAHYAAPLAAGGVAPRALAFHHRAALGPLHGEGRGALPPELVALLERHVAAGNLLPLIAALRADPPQVLHCWLDEPNCVGALAGLVAGVPRILVSTRNLNPTHFAFYKPWFREHYRALAAAPQVVFVANSAAGARDYAAWADLPVERFQVVHNGFDPRGCAPLDPAARAAERRRLGLDPEAFWIVSAFRAAREKRPGDYLQVVAEVARAAPDARFLHLGGGEEWAAFAAEARRRGLTDGGPLTLLGRVDDPWAWLRLGDAGLLTSGQEGLPNVALELQAHEVPPVLTEAGGSREAVRDGETAAVLPVGDVPGLTAALLALRADPARRRAMGRAGAAWVQDAFSLARSAAAHDALYRGEAP